MWKSLTFGAIALALCATLVGWSHAGRLRHTEVRRLPATGLVLGTTGAHQVEVAHDDIAGYMPGMTMAFALAAGDRVPLRAGDRIRFTLRTGAEGTWIEGVTVTGHETLNEAGRRLLAPVDRLRRGDQLPAVALVDQDGRALATADLRGHATVLTFIFTRCPIPEYCPLVSRRFTQLQAALAIDGSARNTRLLSVTLDPDFDTAPVLTAYARSLNADPARWRFAGGDPDEVMRLARSFSVYVERHGALLDHTLATALVDPEGRVAEIWRGSGWKVSEVVDALHALPGHAQ
ncbi:MAG: SCO family protein [Vicinamibacterales bacterium]